MISYVHIYIYVYIYFPGCQGFLFIEHARKFLPKLAFHPMPGDADPKVASTATLMPLLWKSLRKHQPDSRKFGERIVLGCNSYDKQGQKPKETYTEPTSTLCGKEKIPYVKLSHTPDGSSVPSLISPNCRVKSFCS